MSAKKTQVLFVFGALVLFVLLYIAPKTAVQKESNANIASGNKQASVDVNAGIDMYVNQALKKLTPQKKQVLERYLTLSVFDSAVAFWDKQKQPDIASYYTEVLAKKRPSAKNWLSAGNRYYYAVQFSADQTEIPLLFGSAIRCLLNSLKLEPENTDAKILLGSCYVEGTENPMEGIAVLKEVEKKDSNNVKLQAAFASFSVKSGQLNKAIYRYNKILQLDSNNIAVYLYLADIYEQQNNTQKTIEVLEKYAAKTDDVTAKLEIKKYIQQLKK